MRLPGRALRVHQRFRRHRFPLLPGLPHLPGPPRFPRQPAAEGLQVQGAVSPVEAPRGEAAAEAVAVRQARPQERRDTRPPRVAEAVTRTDVR